MGKEEKHETSKILQEIKTKSSDDDMTIKKSKKFHILYEKNMHLTKKI